jgi:hypothetical protein
MACSLGRRNGKCQRAGTWAAYRAELCICPCTWLLIWTEDTDFFAWGVATWTSNRLGRPRFKSSLGQRGLQA